MVIVKTVFKRNCKGEQFGKCYFIERKGEESLEKVVLANSIKIFQDKYYRKIHQIQQQGCLSTWQVWFQQNEEYGNNTGIGYKVNEI